MRYNPRGRRLLISHCRRTPRIARRARCAVRDPAATAAAAAAAGLVGGRASDVDDDGRRIITAVLRATRCCDVFTSKTSALHCHLRQHCFSRL